MISNSTLQAEKLASPRAFLARDYGASFADEVSSAVPLKAQGVTLGYFVRRKGPKAFNFSSVRAQEIQRLAFHRFRFDPPTAEGERRIAIAIANHSRRHPKLALAWIQQWCANINAEDAIEIVEEAADMPLRWKAAELGDFLDVTRDERDHLGITTFRAAGQTKRELTANRKLKARERMRLVRAAEQAANPKPISMEKAQPWKAEGISRTTWYRRQKAARETAAQSSGTDFVRTTAIGRAANRTSPNAGGHQAAAQKAELIRCVDGLRAVPAKAPTATRSRSATPCALWQPFANRGALEHWNSKAISTLNWTESEPFPEVMG